jgi:hypothetical protein
MKSIVEFLAETRRAANVLFAGVADYRDLLRKPEAPAAVFSGSDFEKQHEEYLVKHRDAIARDLERERTFISEYFALSTLCGAIIQLAHQSIMLCSSESEVQPEFVRFVGKNQTAPRFCVGRIIRNVPLGLIVYAARNQHAHLYQELHGTNTCVFSELAKYDGAHGGSPWSLGEEFEVTSENAESKAPNVVSMLEWESIDSYERDLTAALGDE